MQKLSLIVLLATTFFVSGCYTKSYVRAMQNQQAQSVPSDSNQVASQAHN